MTDTIKTMQQIWDEAHAAAQVAMDEMIAKYGYDFGCCGYTSVIIRPARGPFVKWCKDQIKAAVKAVPANASSRDHHMGNQNARMIYGDNHYKGGWEIFGAGSRNYHGQALDVKDAAARAFAKVLTDNGIAAHWTSRMD